MSVIYKVLSVEIVNRLVLPAEDVLRDYQCQGFLAEFYNFIENTVTRLLQSTWADAYIDYPPIRTLDCSAYLYLYYWEFLLSWLLPVLVLASNDLFWTTIRLILIYQN